KYAVRLRAPWVMLLALAVLATYVALGLLSVRSFNDYRTRSLATEGVVAANRLKAEILETYRSKGASDMSCDAARCPFTGIAGVPSAHVRALRSDRSGVITVELADTVAKAPHNRLVFKPFIDGRPVDLSDPRNAAGNPVWRCGSDNSTTVEERHLPPGCR
ncbi:MAG TPA: pilin, partial [Usitatibacteraceae bacterium]|nr:pilin [Usitatibacteraceae bacterium]